MLPPALLEKLWIGHRMNDAFIAYILTRHGLCIERHVMLLEESK